MILWGHTLLALGVNAVIFIAGALLAGGGSNCANDRRPRCR
jgi:hypothetical protein